MTKREKELAYLIRTMAQYGADTSLWQVFASIPSKLKIEFAPDGEEPWILFRNMGGPMKQARNLLIDLEEGDIPVRLKLAYSAEHRVDLRGVYGNVTVYQGKRKLVSKLYAKPQLCCENILWVGEQLRIAIHNKGGGMRTPAGYSIIQGSSTLAQGQVRLLADQQHEVYLSCGWGTLQTWIPGKAPFLLPVPGWYKQEDYDRVLIHDDWPAGERDAVAV